MGHQTGCGSETPEQKRQACSYVAHPQVIKRRLMAVGVDRLVGRPVGVFVDSEKSARSNESISN